MNKDKLLALIKSKEEARNALVTKSNGCKEVDELRGINTQIQALNSDITEFRSMLSDIEAAGVKNTDGPKAADETRTATAKAETEKRAKGETEKRVQWTPGMGFIPLGGAADERAAKNHEIMEQRGKDLREGRSITVASSGIVLPNQASTNINQPFQQVSSLIDGVNVLPLQGGESYAQPYEKAVADATTVAEDGTPDDTDTTFDKANIAKAKLVAYSEITEEVMKLPSANYADVVLQNITVSLRKKIAKEIMVGTGATNHMVGIFSSLAEAIVPSTDISLAAIDNTTLNKIVFGYGGDEAVEGQSVLILNKKDLAAFAALRTTDGKPFHTIVTRGGYGTIDGYPFIINSACSALTDSATASAAYCMAYGNLKNYQLTIFSDIDVKRSTDYKFKEGMIANRGVVFAGGNVVSYNGFLRVKKS